MTSLPHWLVEGARVKVKSTPEIKRYGIPGHGGGFATAGEVGRVERHAGSLRVRFPGGVTVKVDEDNVEQFADVKRWLR